MLTAGGKANRVKERGVWRIVQCTHEILFQWTAAPAAGTLRVGSLSRQPLRIASSVDRHLAKVMPTSTG